LVAINSYRDGISLLGKMRWEALPAVAKRNRIAKQADTKSRSWLDFLFRLGDRAPKPVPQSCELRSVSPVEVPLVPEPTPLPRIESKLLLKFCIAIQMHEGWSAPSTSNPTGTRSYRNNNPGNIEYGEFAKSCGANGQDDKGFAKFESYLDGFNALKALIVGAATGNPVMTLEQFFSKYALSGDGNDPSAYAGAIARKLGVDCKTFVISQLI
jgi:hypothetical protein